MWEARAVEGCGPELLAWARQAPLAGTPVRRETFRADGERVLVITWWADDTPAPPELPDPPAALVTRPVHRWQFDSVEVAGAG
jgi:hypothetical protein